MAGFLEKNISALAGAFERAVANERWSREDGLLQRIDPRFKIASFAAMILACSLARGPAALAVLYAVATALAVSSRIGVAAFTRRIWVFVPLFTVVVAVPALFLTPGERVAALGPFGVTAEGAWTALTLVLRVSASVSFAVLLVLTTPWHTLLSALRSLRLPGIAVSLLSLCYRYLLLLVRAVPDLFMARRSRTLAPLPIRREAAFMSRSAGLLFVRSLALADGVHLAMLSRGWDPEGSAPAGGTRDRGTHEPEPVELPLFAGGRAAGGGDAAFELSDVSYAYPGGETALEIDRLAVPRGRCTVLLGPNGSGKSTLLKILDGLVFPQKGAVTAFGAPVTERGLDDGRARRGFRGRIGLVFQDPDVQCFSPTVREELAFGPRQMGFDDEETARRVDAALAALRIEGIADRYPYRLSGGEKKRVALASILTMDLEAFLLDEPTASLDPATEGILIDILAGLAAHGKTIVAATQDLLLARHIGEFAVVLGPGRRRLFAGPVEIALGDAALLERAGLAHAHRLPHRRAAADYRHSHYREEDKR
ncbi:MAG: cobalt ECF transporter T component CbiQ [Candidatus Latescibacterota bacterium]|nr:MAG: cobalt ECF transporter T component CbiQ [Candidatus Latescibacterota bacterium]